MERDEPHAVLGPLRSENTPAWLLEQRPRFTRAAFFGSRVVYYPGFGDDGHPVEVFGARRIAHAFVFVDFAVGARETEDRLHNRGTERGFRGYRPLVIEHLGVEDLCPGRARIAVADGWFGPLRAPWPVVHWHATFAVLERQAPWDDAHGPTRFAALFIGADGIAAYGKLFCRDVSIQPPHVVLLHDHNFGGNHDRFGAGGLLESLASKAQRLPDWLLVAEGTEPWTGYSLVEDVAPMAGGHYPIPRRLYRRD